MKKLFLSFVVIIFLISGLFCGCTEQKKDREEAKSGLIEYDDKTINSRFGFMHPEHFEEMVELNVFWQRPHPGSFIWDKIEENSGIFNWKDVDDEVKLSQSWGINILATVWPFAEWDQKSCHQMLSSDKTKDFHELGDYRQKPCDLEAYQSFISLLVERYDGDGVDDMPDLKFPIKYWEVSNEPSMQDDLVFFKGTSEDYFEILKATYNGVKSADSTSYVLMGGMAGLGDDNKKFWEDVFELGGIDYFDICNIHSVGSSSTSIYGSEFNDYLNEYGIKKPFWITEAEFSARGLGKNELSEKEWSNFLVTSFVQAFAAGAEKIFYIGLEQSPTDSEAWLIKDSDKQDIYFAFQTMVEKIDYFTSVEKLDIGQYKFKLGDNIVYILWGENDVAEEIVGTIKVTDVSGTQTVINSIDLMLNDSPVFVEMTRL